jgi:hypothetical protein
VAYTSGLTGSRDIVAIGLDGNNQRRLTSKPADETSPAWSTRNAVAFVRETDAGDGDIWSVGANGGERRLTGGGADDRDPTWSPDGRWVAFARDARGRRDIYVANDRGHRLRKLRSLPGTASTPVWSPDGRWIAFAMGKRGKRGIYVMRSNGKRLRRVAGGRADARALDWQARPGDPVIAAAGDVACDPSSPYWRDGYGSGVACHELATSDLMLRMDLSAVFMLGDGQYEDGSLDKFRMSYDPTWGRLKALTRPVIGNHEYGTPGAAGYFDYFNGAGKLDGPAGRRGEAWYSFDIGAWHVVALNSNCSEVSCAPGSPQDRWLRADLAAHPARCTAALIHHPLVTSGEGDTTANGEPASTPAVQPLWQALYEANADLVLSGHDHTYERFAPLDPNGAVDPARGMREIVSGAGGKNVQAAVAIRPGSEVRNATSLGVARITFHPTGYDWQFVPDTPGGFTDAGSGACH